MLALAYWQAVEAQAVAAQAVTALWLAAWVAPWTCAPQPAQETRRVRRTLPPGWRVVDGGRAA